MSEQKPAPAPPPSLLLPSTSATTTITTKPEKNGIFTGSSPLPPPPSLQTLLSSSPDLSPGLPMTTPQILHKSPSPSTLSGIDLNNTSPVPDLQRTPRPRIPSSSHLLPPDAHQSQQSSATSSQQPSRPTSQASFISNASSTSRPNSPLCTPKIRDFAYPKTHKYHAPSYNRRYSTSSRSSTSSDLDSFFPQRISGTGHLYGAEDAWKQQADDDADLGDGDFSEEVDGDEEIVERRAVCVFDFTAEYDGEISIETGQVVWVEFRKGVSGWLVVRDEITECKGLVPEGYVRFLNEEEERQYLAQSPPSNTLLPRNQENVTASLGDETPRPTLATKHPQWDTVTEDHEYGEDEQEWIDYDPEGAEGREDRNVDSMITGVQNVTMQR